jgi:hypothetical protein
MKISRIDLFELVWSKPMTKLAIEYGFSDVGFSKICKKYHIPTPPRGYWAKLAAGYKSAKPKLPKENNNPTIFIVDKTPLTLEQLQAKKLASEKRRISISEIGNILETSVESDCLQLTVNTKKFFEKTFKDINTAASRKSLPKNYLAMLKIVNRGRVVSKENRCFNLNVSEKLVDRALYILDAIAQELLIRKFKLQFTWDEKSGYAIYALKDDEKIYFKLIEGYKYVPISRKDNERTELDKILYRDREPQPTGNLSFIINERLYQCQRIWQDGKKLIENKLADIVLEFENLILIQKQIKIEANELERKRKESARINAEREAKRNQEQKIYEQAICELHEYKMHLDLLEYLNAIELKILDQDGDMNNEVRDWIKSVRDFAEKQNPINKHLVTKDSTPINLL